MGDEPKKLTLYKKNGNFNRRQREFFLDVNQEGKSAATKKRISYLYFSLMITFFDSQLATGSTPKNGDASGCEVVEKWGYVIDRIEDARARPASKRSLLNASKIR